MISLLDVEAGDTVHLIDGRAGFVVQNMGDGQRIEVRFPEQDDGEEPELIHSQDVAEVVRKEGS